MVSPLKYLFTYIFTSDLISFIVPRNVTFQGFFLSPLMFYNKTKRSHLVNGFSFYLSTQDSKMSVFIIDLTSELQTHISSCLFDMSTWISLGYLKFSSFKIKFIIFPLPKLILASVLTISENDNYQPYG